MHQFNFVGLSRLGSTPQYLSWVPPIAIASNAQALTEKMRIIHITIAGDFEPLDGKAGIIVKRKKRAALNLMVGENRLLTDQLTSSGRSGNDVKVAGEAHSNAHPRQPPLRFLQLKRSIQAFAGVRNQPGDEAALLFSS